MVMRTIDQPMFNVDTISERDSLLANFPLIEEKTLCFVEEDSNTYRLFAGLWTQFHPDSSVSLMNTTIAAMQTAITNLQTSKADASALATLQSTVSSLTLDTIPEGVTNKYFTAAEKAKLAGLSNPAARSVSSVTRPINSTPFQVSATQDSDVYYVIKQSTSLSLTGGTVADVYLDIATDSAFTTPINIASLNNGNTGALTIGLALSQTAAGVLAGYVPKGFYARIRTVNTTGTPTFTYISGREVLL